MSDPMALRGEFSVAQFFADTGTYPDCSYEYVRRWVTGEEAVKALKHYISSVAAKTGLIEAVIVVDGGDLTNIEWRKGKGFVFPPEYAALNEQLGYPKKEQA